MMTVIDDANIQKKKMMKQSVFILVQTGPVGTNYARVIPSKEINSKDRDNFWKREEEEERHRIDLEAKRREKELEKQEEERRQREELEHKRRLVDTNNDENQINGNAAYAPVIKRFESILDAHLGLRVLFFTAFDDSS